MERSRTVRLELAKAVRTCVTMHRIVVVVSPSLSAAFLLRCANVYDSSSHLPTLTEVEGPTPPTRSVSSTTLAVLYATQICGFQGWYAGHLDIVDCAVPMYLASPGNPQRRACGQCGLHAQLVAASSNIIMKSKIRQ